LNLKNGKLTYSKIFENGVVTAALSYSSELTLWKE